MLEHAISQRTELEWCRLGGLPQRNNVGACIDSTGREVRYGLLNKSKKQNQSVKSSDLVGPMPILITQAMVGRLVGVYAAIETKRSDWHLTAGDEHGHAQAEYHRVIRLHGGMAGFATCPEDVLKIVREFCG